MIGFDVNFTLEDCVEEFSRRLILPEKTTFLELEKIIKTVFSFSGESSPEFDLADKNIEGRSLISIDEYITHPITYEFDWSSRFVSEDLRDDWRVKITLNQIINYEKNHASLISYTGKAIPHEGSGGINGFNTMLLKNYNLDKINPSRVQEKLSNIKSVKFNAYILKINCEKTKKALWRKFLIPEKTTFKELEKIIIISFDVNKVSFEADESEVADELMRKSRFYSQERNFSFEVEKTIFSRINSPLFLDFDGGNDPSRLWEEYYPKKSLTEDNSQSSLDDYFK